jgi:tellurium resistance protein TerD
MTVSLTKGESLDLVAKAGGTLELMRIGLGWDAGKSGAPFDLDASIIGLNDAGVSAGQDWFVFYNNLSSPDGAIVHQGDERTGDTDGDDEQILVSLAKIPESIAKFLVVVTIHEAATRGQNFGMVANAYVRAVNEADGAELARYDLSEDGGANTSFVLGEGYRHNGTWKFKALPEGFATGMQGVIDKYKIA